MHSVFIRAYFKKKKKSAQEALIYHLLAQRTVVFKRHENTTGSQAKTWSQLHKWASPFFWNWSYYHYPPDSCGMFWDPVPYCPFPLPHCAPISWLQLCGHQWDTLPAAVFWSLFVVSCLRTHSGFSVCFNNYILLRTLNCLQRLSACLFARWASPCSSLSAWFNPEPKPSQLLSAPQIYISSLSHPLPKVMPAIPFAFEDMLVVHFSSLGHIFV